jgi:hypothetical protein
MAADGTSCHSRLREISPAAGLANRAAPAFQEALRPGLRYTVHRLGPELPKLPQPPSRLRKIEAHDRALQFGPRHPFRFKKKTLNQFFNLIGIERWPDEGRISARNATLIGYLTSRCR